MGINDIKYTLLTPRMHNERKVRGREGEDSNGPGSEAFMQHLNNSEGEGEESESNAGSNPAEDFRAATHPLPKPPPKELSKSEIEKLRDGETAKPGQLIDVEA